MKKETTSRAKGGKRVQRGSRLPLLLVAVVAVLAAIFAVYFLTSDQNALPAAYVQIPGQTEPLDLGGMTPDEAAQALTEAAQVGEERSVTLTCAGQTLTIPAASFQPNVQELISQIQSGVESQTWQLTYTVQGMDSQLAALAEQTSVAPIDPVYTVGEETVEVVTGTPGAALDPEAATAAILEAFYACQTTVELAPQAVDPAPLTAQDINEAVYVAPAPATTDENGNAIPPVVGISIEVEGAQAMLDAAQPGETVSIPLVRTHPDYSQSGGEGFPDLLSECITNIGGSSGRLNNVKLSAQKCNELVLMPGDTFDYNKVVGKRTAEAGFSSAPAYYNGQTVNEIGGGICQTSSSVYYCAVYANLKIVTRSNHRYAVGYVPDGLDATVSWGGPEFRFKNDSDYPIKIVTSVNGRTLTVRFYGTNPDGTYVKTERSQLSSTPYKTVYQADSSIPQGTTKEKISPYSGRSVVVYRCVYAADGTLLSRTKENTSNYSHRDKVILYNPADAASLGLAPETPPVETAPVETAPVESTPVESAPVESTPVESTPVEPAPEESTPVESTPVESTPVESAPVESTPVEEPPMQSAPIEEAPAPSQPADDPAPAESTEPQA